MDLINMVPVDSLATSGYCLASKGSEYVVYIPGGTETEIDLTSDQGDFGVEWFDTNTGEKIFRDIAGPAAHADRQNDR